MIRAITALTLAVGMCLSSAAFAAPVAKPAAPHAQVLRKAKLANLKSVKKTTTMKRQPRMGSNKVFHGKIKRTFRGPLLRTSKLQRVK